MSDTIYTVTFVTMQFDAFPDVVVMPCRTKELAEELSEKRYNEINEIIKKQKDAQTGFIVLDPDKTFYAQFKYNKEALMMCSIIQPGKIYEKESDLKSKSSFIQRIFARKK